jgi:predicted dithiol-disulfide oxidoreductase (DUF899 family)
MTKHTTGTRDEWLAARLELLAAEKELVRRSDELARRRQELPWVRIDKDYRFETDAGSASLADLFRGRSQLLVYHFMFGPDYTAGCPSCSAIADGFNGSVVHLANHDVTLCAVSRAPMEKLQAYKRRMGWTFPWASSFGSDFNADFNVWFSEEQQRQGGIEYNCVGAGYLFVWTMVGIAAYPVGVALAAVAMEQPALARAVPAAVGVAVVVAGIFQWSAWKARHLTCCREAPSAGRELAADARTAWRHGVQLGLHCSICCAGLIAILLVIGVMDLRAMAVVTAAITLERLAPAGVRVARATGAAVVAMGLLLIARAAGLG